MKVWGPNNRVNLTAGSSVALRGQVIGAVRLPVALNPRINKKEINYGRFNY